MSADLWWADPDPWALSPEEQERRDETARRHQEELEAIPEEPPY